ncbi:riboflavin synthase [Acuticoccus mangrovi]|uniref:Riboflavin synthase n=1 Tax=Acuticoccus mangrovi TaxID=2796142 RepID=A0A934ISZ9_9HYPH|nr:riboflavin synthase [Acuticoccus mangrovi]MBJ3778175.1 riboflavin synthase [Acuticoccus mangrovi]
MFTGIVTDVGRIVDKIPFGDGARLAIECTYPADGIAIGASIACGGCCLTATTVSATASGARFTVDVSAESMDKTTIGGWAVGDPINLERSLKAGDELGGHIVSGHVDGRAEIVAREDEEDMSLFRFAPPSRLLSLIAEKGSVALDGTSLTVVEASDTFTVAMIPHTLAVTTWHRRRVGDLVNIEIDTIARYVARLVAMRETGN